MTSVFFSFFLKSDNDYVGFPVFLLSNGDLYFYGSCRIIPLFRVSRNVYSSSSRALLL